MLKSRLALPETAVVDSWPAARLVAVFLALSGWTHWRFGWHLPSLERLGALGAGLWFALGFCVLVSRPIAEIALLGFAVPLYLAVLLNKWLYGLCHWTFRTALRLLYIRRVSALVALAGEIALFIGCGRAIEEIAKRCLLQ